MSDECKCGFDHWPLPCKTYNAADRSLASSLAAPTGSAEMVRLPNDTKIKFCNAMDALRRHAILGGKMTCQYCAVYMTWGDGDLCPKGKDIIAMELAYADTKIEFPSNAPGERPATDDTR